MSNPAQLALLREHCWPEPAETKYSQNPQKDRQQGCNRESETGEQEKSQSRTLRAAAGRSVAHVPLSQCPPRYFPLSVRLHWTQLLPCLTCFPCLHVAPQVSESSGCRERHTEDGRRVSVYVREIWSGERAAAGGGLTKITTSSY